MIHAQLHKAFKGKTGNFNLSVSLQIKSGDITCIYGPSGAGKSSILKMLSGLLTPDNGIINVQGRELFNAQNKINIKAQKRNMSYVFQQGSLFPNMTVAKNLDYAQGDAKHGDLRERLIAQAELTDLLNRYPETLSGGQQQRVALVRALIQPAALTLLDEPLAALDDSSRTKLQNLIFKLQQETQRTLIMVSHKLSEVIKLANHVYCLEAGKITAQGTPQALFLKPSAIGSQSFIGEVLRAEQTQDKAQLWVMLPNGIVNVPIKLEDIKKFSVGAQVQLTQANFNPEVHTLEY